MSVHPWDLVAVSKVKDKGEVWHYWCISCGVLAKVWAPRPGKNAEEYHSPGVALPKLDGEPPCVNAATGEVIESDGQGHLFGGREGP